MAFDKAFAINTMYPLANAAYLVMDVPPPPLSLPAGFASVGIIVATDLEDVSAIPESASDSVIEMANKTVSENKNFGLVAWNDATKTAIVSIRGTKTIWEWIADAGALPVPYFQDPGAGLAHLGFQIVYQRIRDSIAGLLRANCQGAQTLWVTGHSMGGALAILCAYDILKEVNLGPVPQLYTFAGPRVLAPDFADTFNTAIHICNRVVNFLDFVPQIPTPPLYEHAGQETLVKGGFNAFDISFAHHLTTYLNGLNQLP